MSRLDREEILHLIIDALCDELAKVRKELKEGEEAMSDKKKHRLRLTLRLVSKTLSDILEAVPEEVNEDGILTIISRAEKVVSRRFRTELSTARRRLIYRDYHPS